MRDAWPEGDQQPAGRKRAGDADDGGDGLAHADLMTAQIIIAERREKLAGTLLRKSVSELYVNVPNRLAVLSWAYARYCPSSMNLKRWRLSRLIQLIVF